MATGVLLVLAAWEASLLIPLMGLSFAGGPESDFAYYLSVARQWLDTGTFYHPMQLAGPHAPIDDVANLYPPIALYLFVPFELGVPHVLWFAIPAAVLGYALWCWQPAPWSWPLMAFGIFWHNGLNDAFHGNTNIWTTAAVAGALLRGWPVALIFLKPGWGFLAAFGLVRWQGAMVGIVVLAVLSLPLLPLWADYVTALSNLEAVPFWWSWASAPLVLIPVWAWLARRREENGEARHPIRSTWARRRRALLRIRAAVRGTTAPS